MNAVAQRRLTPPLGIAVLVFGALWLALLAGLGRGVRWAPPRPVEPLPAQHAAALPPPVPLEQYAIVWTKPLFNADRKPDAQVGGDGSGNLGDMQLTGIILTPGLHMALLKDKSGQEFRVREGAALPDGSWTLSEIRPRSALFASSAGRTELKLPNGAPIDLPAKTDRDTPANPAPASADNAAGQASGDGVQVMPAPGTRMQPVGQPRVGVPMDAQQLRIQRLKEMIQRRRAQQQGQQRPDQGER